MRMAYSVSIMLIVLAGVSASNAQQAADPRMSELLQAGKIRIAMFELTQLRHSLPYGTGLWIAAVRPALFSNGIHCSRTALANAELLFCPET